MTASSGAAFYLGVDGGGSKTLAVVVDSGGKERGRGLAGSANQAAVGIEQAVRNLRSACEAAARAAHTELPVRRAWLGLAGMDRPDDIDLLRPHLPAFATASRVSNDAELVLSALDGAVGVALIAGTGSIAVGRDAAGATARAGGWGHLLGDEGSGYALGSEALRAALRAADGRGPATLLLERILVAWNLARASDLLGPVYGAPSKARIAQLSPLVLQAARDGDAVASGITRQAAHELALAAVTVGKALSFPLRLPLALGGGLLVHEADFRHDVVRRIQTLHPLERVETVEEPALSGAQAAARDDRRG